MPGNDIKDNAAYASTGSLHCPKWIQFRRERPTSIRACRVSMYRSKYGVIIARKSTNRISDQHVLPSRTVQCYPSGFLYPLSGNLAHLPLYLKWPGLRIFPRPVKIVCAASRGVGTAGTGYSGLISMWLWISIDPVTAFHSPFPFILPCLAHC